MKLEKYIKENREFLDVEKPNKELLWENISKQLTSKKRKKHFQKWKIAAVVIVVIGFSFLAYQNLSIRNNQNLILRKIDPALAKEEAKFQKQIEIYYQVLQKTNYDKNTLPTSIKNVEYIDDLIKKYLEDLQKYGPNSKLLKSLMDLYQKKIMLLNRMLEEIERNKKNESDFVSM